MATKKEKKRRQDTGASDLQMTPMIDVVFQLLIYFIVTLKPIDISSHLDVYKPASIEAPDDAPPPPRMIRIQIFPGALIMNERSVSLDTMTDILDKLAAINTKQSVVISCARDSQHDTLIQVLDRCAKAGLVDLSVVSMN